MEADTFIFCQHDLMYSSFAAFNVMKQNGELVDFKVNLQDRSFFAHRVVLAATIPYLRTMFTNSVTEIPIEGIDPDIFESIINFAYSGKIKISTGNVQSLITASQFLQLVQVHEACVKFMSMQINIDNVFEVRALAGNIESLRLATACDVFILRNFEEFVRRKSSQFLQLPFQYLRDIISRDELNVAKEEIVFEAILKWVEGALEERHDDLPEMLRAVRMTRLDKQYLVQRVSNEKLITASSSSKYLVEQIKNYHLLTKTPQEFLRSLNTCTRNSTCHGLYAICESPRGYSVELYDMARGMWVTLAQIGSQETNNVVGYDGKIYFLEKDAKAIGIFDAKTYKTKQLSTSLDTSRPSENVSQVVLHKDKLYAFTAHKMYCFDPKKVKWLGLRAVVDSNQSGLASFGQYIYITGGCFQGSETSVCKRYNPSLGTPNEISPMLRERWGHGCAGLNGKVYVCGGSLWMKSEVYDPFTDQWSYFSPRGLASLGTSLVQYKGKLYALSKSVATVYDPERDFWTRGVPIPPCCKHIKYMTIPYPEDEKGCPEFSDLRLQLQAGFSTGR